MNKNIFSWVIIVILLLFQIVLILKDDSPDSGLVADSSAVQWDGEHKVDKLGNQYGGIVIPGYDYICMKADSCEQRVNFHNPAENNCLFKFELCVKDVLVWQSEYVAPGFGFYDITMSQDFPAGEYFGSLKIRCFKESGEELNSAKVLFEVIMQEDVE